MKRVYQVEVETEEDFELDTISLAARIAWFAHKQTVKPESGEGWSDRAQTFKVRADELRTRIVLSEPKPISVPPAERAKLNGDPRKCNSEKLLEIIATDSLCTAYQNLPTFKSLLDPDGQHLVIMLLPFVNVEQGTETLRHRVDVMAKAAGSMKSLDFQMDIPTAIWEKLHKV